MLILEGKFKYDFDIILTTDVLTEKIINDIGPNVIVNYILRRKTYKTHSALRAYYRISTEAKYIYNSALPSAEEIIVSI